MAKQTAEKKKDRRIERTRQLLLQALFPLVQEKGFDAVTVQDIIDRANVGWWIEGKRRMTVEEVNDLFRRMGLPAVKAALR